MQVLHILAILNASKHDDNVSRNFNKFKDNLWSNYKYDCL